MHKDQDVLSLIRELDEQFIKTNHLPLDKPDYQKIKQTPFWTINLCFDILVNLKDASMVYERLESMKNDFFVKNTNIDLSFINTIIHLKYGHEKASELKKLIVEMMQDYMLSKQDAGESYLPDETSKQKTKQDLKKIENKIKKLHEKFNDEYPKIDQALQYVFICLRDVQDLFKSKNFIDVEIEGTPGKCKPFKFIKWAKENGYKIPHMLEIIYDKSGNIHWRDPLVFENLEQTFPKHPKGKELKDDPLYIAVKVREALMNGEIKISEYKPVKKQLTSYLKGKYAHLSGIKQKEIVALVNDGYGHGGNRNN